MSKVAAAGRELVEVLGDKQLIAAFEALATKAQARAARRALSAGSRMLRDAIKSEVPEAKTKGHSNRNVRDGVGARQGRRRRSGEYEAKAGVQVGLRQRRGRVATSLRSLERAAGSRRKSSRELVAPHFHLLALGTIDRYTGASRSTTRAGRRTGLKNATGNPRRFRGRMPSDDFVVRGTSKASASAQLEMLRIMREVIEEEAAKNAQP